MTNPITIGLFAHVDAGKTTLSEALLWKCGAVKEIGRVDKGNSHLDSDTVERKRGITIYSKTAPFEIDGKPYYLVDTPGHSDFLAGAWRTIGIIDIAILLVNAGDGLNPHTHKLWQLLKESSIPTIIFVNKMDMPGLDRQALCQDLKKKLTDKLIDFSDMEQFRENLAMADDRIMKAYLDTGQIPNEDIKQAFMAANIYPLLFGSALKDSGINELLSIIKNYSDSLKRPEELQAIVYKIERDDKGLKVNHIRNFKSPIRIKDEINGEKVQEIRKYRGKDYINIQVLDRGEIAGLVGPTKFRAGDLVGEKNQGTCPVKALFLFKVEAKNPGHDHRLEQAIVRLAEEFPEMEAQSDRAGQGILIKSMGKIGLEVLEDRLNDEGIGVEFSQAPIEYRESVKGKAIGIGHFEPIGHYVEVQLALEPGEVGTGIEILNCLKNPGSDNKFKIVKDSLKSGVPGVLAGRTLTDVVISILDIRESKHSQIEDFIQAGIRALRQALMQVESVLLEKFIKFRIRLDSKYYGQVIQDLQTMGIDDYHQEIGAFKTTISGRGPVSKLQKYLMDLPSKSAGSAEIDIDDGGYMPVDNPSEIIESFAYDPLKDPDFPPSSIFFKKGSGFAVDWDKVEEFAHGEIRKSFLNGDSAEETLESSLVGINQGSSLSEEKRYREKTYRISKEEIDRIFRDTFFANSNPDKERKKQYFKKIRIRKKTEEKAYKPASKPRSNFSLMKKNKEAWLLIDGYNVLNSLPQMEGRAEDMNFMRPYFIELLTEYAALIQAKIIVVFDAYRVKGGRRKIEKRGGIHVVYTEEAETADQYIAKVTKEKADKNEIIVASSDGAVQLITWKEGALVISGRELVADMIEKKEETLKEFRKTAPDPLTKRLGNERSPDEFK